jgi:hypothetical protein
MEDIKCEGNKNKVGENLKSTKGISIKLLSEDDLKRIRRKEWNEGKRNEKYYHFDPYAFNVHNLQLKFLSKFMEISESQISNTAFQFISNVISHKQE